MFKQSKEEMEQASLMLLENILEKKNLNNIDILLTVNRESSMINSPLLLESINVSLLPKNVNKNVLYVNNINNQYMDTLIKNYRGGEISDEENDLINSHVLSINIVELRPENYLKNIQNIVQNLLENLFDSAFDSHKNGVVETFERKVENGFNFIMSADYLKNIDSFAQDKEITNALHDKQDIKKSWEIIKSNLLKHNVVEKESINDYEKIIDIAAQNFHKYGNTKTMNQYAQYVFSPMTLFKRMNMSCQMQKKLGNDVSILVDFEEDQKHMFRKKISFEKEGTYLIYDADVIKKLNVSNKEFKKYYEENNRFILKSLGNKKISKNVVLNNLMLDPRINGETFMDDLISCINDKDLKTQEEFINNLLDIEIDINKTQRFFVEKRDYYKLNLLMNIKRKMVSEEDFIDYWKNIVAKNRVEANYGFFTERVKELFDKNKIATNETLRELFPEVSVNTFSELLYKKDVKIDLLHYADGNKQAHSYYYDFQMLDLVLKEKGRNIQTDSLIISFVKNICEKLDISVSFNIKQKNKKEEKEYLYFNLITSNDDYLSEDFIKSIIDKFEDSINSSNYTDDKQSTEFKEYLVIKNSHINEFLLEEKLRVLECKSNKINNSNFEDKTVKEIKRKKI